MIGVLLLFIWQDDLILLYILFAFSLVAFLLALTKIYVFRKKIPSTGKTKILRENQKEIIHTVMVYISPFLIWGAAGWFQTNGEKWIINGVLSVTDVGIYAIMMAVVNALVIIPNNIINEFATPIIFKQFADMSNRKNIITGYMYIKINMVIILLITVASTVLTFLWGKELIILISSTDYSVYWYILPVSDHWDGIVLYRAGANPAGPWIKSAPKVSCSKNNNRRRFPWDKLLFYFRLWT